MLQVKKPHGRNICKPISLGNTWAGQEFSAETKCGTAFSQKKGERTEASLARNGAAAEMI